jgi:hypothetical protein
MSLSSSPGRNDGFTAIPRLLFDLLLCLPLTKRDLTILLLVARLTYGCRDAEWVSLKKADLAAVGIGSNHAKSCLQSLLVRKFLLRKGNCAEYRINDKLIATHLTNDAAKRLDRLSVLVGQQLAIPSRNGNSLPDIGSPLFPNGEVSPSQNGNISQSPGWSFSRSRRRFEKNFNTS